jgi:large subunit ribosomal protein L24
MAARTKLKIRSGDDVIVIGGKDRGKTGRVLRVEPAKQRLYVEGLNMIKRHQKPTALNPNAQAGVIEREGPIHVSNVALVDPKDKHKPTRIGVTRDAEGKRVRVARRSGTQID